MCSLSSSSKCPRRSFLQPKLCKHHAIVYPALVIPGRSARTEPGISRFRVRLYEAPRNDGANAHEPSLPCEGIGPAILTLGARPSPLARCFDERRLPAAV